MTQKEVIKYLEKNEIFNQPIVSALGAGNNSNAFLIKDNKKIFVFRAHKKNTATKSRLKYQYKILKFLESEKVNFTQRAIFFDSRNQILITTYLAGKNIVLTGLTEAQLKEFVSKLYKLHSLSYSRYKKFCKKNNFQIESPESPVSGFNKYALERFKIVKKYCDDESLVEWIEQALKATKKKIKLLKWKNNKAIFNHGDITGSNIFICKDRLFLIDWDMARFDYRPEYEIAYMLTHFEYFKEKKNDIVNIYAKKAKLNIDELKSAIHRSQLIIMLNGIIWAAQIYTEMKKNGIRGYGKYKQLAHQRIKEYKIFKL